MSWHVFNLTYGDYRIVVVDGEPVSILREDGTRFDGELAGSGGEVTGELVFNTSITGYQEAVTDPSYAGQIITFTTPHIGNYGVNRTDFEARRPFCRCSSR